MRKAEIQKHVEAMMHETCSDATAMKVDPFEKTFSPEEWDYFIKLLIEKSDYLAEHPEIPGPKVIAG
jgi:hypothetical protein